MRINREPSQKVREAARRLIDGDYRNQPDTVDVITDQGVLASAYLDYLIDMEEFSRPVGFRVLLDDALKAINVNNGQCGLIEDVLCRLTSLLASKIQPETLSGPFRVGRFLDIRTDDPTFPTIRDARMAAHEKAKLDRRELWAVWHGDKLDRLFVGGEECEPIPF